MQSAFPDDSGARAGAGLPFKKWRGRVKRAAGASAGQDVLHEAPNEFIRREMHRLPAVAV